MADLVRAVFLDRDGVLNWPLVRDGKPYPPSKLDEFTIMPGVREAVDRFRNAGFWLGVVTNQPDVARGAQHREVVEQMHRFLNAELGLQYFFVCYHDDADACLCRKPKAGLLLDAAARHGISLTDSYMIGDRWRDIDCGNAAGCTTVFLDRGYAERLRSRPHFEAPDLPSASFLICSQT